MTITINGTALNPQPRAKVISSNSQGGKLDGTDALGAYAIIELTSTVARGGTANFNWDSFENSVLTSIALPAKTATLQDANTTYSSGVVASSISVQSRPGNILEQVSMTIRAIV